MQDSAASIGGEVVAVAFVAVILVVLVALRGLINRRIRAVAQALTGDGAKVLSVAPAAHLFARAAVRFELDGQAGRVTVRWWGRALLRVAFHVDSAPRPGVWFQHPGGVYAGASRAAGMQRVISLGAGDVAVATRAPDAVVQQLIASDDAKRLILELVQSTGLATFAGAMPQLAVGPDGLSLEMTRTAYSHVEPTTITPILRKLEALDRAMPHPAGTEMAPLIPTHSPLVSALLPMVLLVPALIAVALSPHHPLESSALATMALVGIVPALLSVFLAWRMLRGGPAAMRQLVFASMGLIPMTVFMTIAVLTGVNARLDSSPAATHRVHVLGYYKRNTHTVYVESWRPGVEREKVIVPHAIASVSPGDVLDLEVRGGALGWPWVSGVVKE